MTKANPSTSNEEVIKFPPVVDNKFCSDLRITFLVSKTPPLLSNARSIEIAHEGSKKFIFEGSALKDSDGLTDILTVKPKEGIKANLSCQKQWEASLKDHSKPLFTLKYSGTNKSIKVSLTNSKKSCDYEIDNFTISDMSGAIRRTAAKVKLNNLLRDDEVIIKIKSTYEVEVEPGYDQAFIFGLVAVLEQLEYLG